MERCPVKMTIILEEYEECMYCEHIEDIRNQKEDYDRCENCDKLLCSECQRTDSEGVILCIECLDDLKQELKEESNHDRVEGSKEKDRTARLHGGT